MSFFIVATAPEIGFGYLKQGEAIGARGFRVAHFVEKPELERARAFLADGGYAWNGGIFASRAGDFCTNWRNTLLTLPMQCVLPWQVAAKTALGSTLMRRCSVRSRANPSTMP